jgi:hypothetical protein
MAEPDFGGIKMLKLFKIKIEEYLNEKFRYKY